MKAISKGEFWSKKEEAFFKFEEGFAYEVESKDKGYKVQINNQISVCLSKEDFDKNFLEVKKGITYVKVHKTGNFEEKHWFEFSNIEIPEYVFQDRYMMYQYLEAFKVPSGYAMESYINCDWVQ